MKNFGLLKVLVPCAWLGLAACGGDDSGKAPVDQGTDHASDEHDSGSSGGSAALDAGADTSTKLDAGKPVVKADAGGARDAASSPTDAKLDGGNKSDASTSVKSDAGEVVKSDAGEVVKTDASTPVVTPPGDKPKPKCVKKDTQVMVIGDSYINWITHTFPQDMAAEAKQTWRMEAVGGYSMGSGGVGLIPTEFDDSIKNDPDCHTILMDGGGNDVLVADSSLDPNRDCLTAKSTTLPQCQMIIDKALAAADALLKKASAAGIRDVVYFFYPHVPEGTALGGDSPNTILDHALPQIRAFCEGIEAETSGKTRCTFIDMVPVFDGHPDWFFSGDIHETSDGSKAMAKQIWKVMTDKCIAQPASSGCCEP